MANVDNAIGFVPTPLVRARRYTRDAGSSTPIYPGDVTAQDVDGKCNAATAGLTTIIGSALTFLTGTAAAPGMFADHPDQEYICQADGALTVGADIGNNGNHVVGTPVLAIKKSGHQLDASDVTNGAAGFALLDFISSPDNEVGTNSRVRVICREHLLKGATNYSGDSS